MGRVTSKANEAKSKMKRSSDMPTSRFERGWLWSVVQHATARPRSRPFDVCGISELYTFWSLWQVWKYGGLVKLYYFACKCPFKDWHIHSDYGRSPLLGATYRHIIHGNPLQSAQVHIYNWHDRQRGIVTIIFWRYRLLTIYTKATFAVLNYLHHGRLNRPNALQTLKMRKMKDETSFRHVPDTVELLNT